MAQLWSWIRTAWMGTYSGLRAVMYAPIRFARMLARIRWPWGGRHGAAAH